MSRNSVLEEFNVNRLAVIQEDMCCTTSCFVILIITQLGLGLGLVLGLGLILVLIYGITTANGLLCIVSTETIQTCCGALFRLTCLHCKQFL